jgi:membrane fusion protein
MTEQPLFRREVIDAGRDRLAGTVVAAVPPSSRTYTWLVAGIAAILLLILMFGSWSSSARVRGIVTFESGIARIYPSAQGEVAQVHVRSGQSVPAGAPLVTLALAQGADGLAAQLAQMDSQDLELARQLELDAAIGATEVSTLEQQRSSLAAAIASLERQRTLAQGQIRLAEAATRRAVQLASEGAGTQRQVEDSRAALLARRAELETLNERLIAQREALRTVSGQASQRRLEAERSRSVLAGQRASLAEQRDRMRRADRLVLTAPVAGEVGDVGVQPGQRAEPERSVVTILPQGSRLEAWLYAPSRAVGFVRPGQQVRLLFDAFPYEKHGAGRGTVVEVSRVPVDPDAIESQLGIDEPVFRIRVRLDRPAPRVPAGERSLRAGMTLTASLILERRSLWELLLAPVLGALRS